jgi:thioester reductase-like protein
MNRPNDLNFAADAQLPDDIVPPPVASPTPIRRVLVTGATGFLGRHLVGRLLTETDWRIACPVRAADAAAAVARMDAVLAEQGLSAAGRVHAFPAALAEPAWGLAANAWEELAVEIDAIFHCAAEVSWIKPYRRLRGSHILGTLNVLRLACSKRRKTVHFVSTLAVCYVPDGPARIDEQSDLLPHAEKIPLGYAQAKCVAESLLRQAAARGLTVTILRAGLLAGHSKTGAANHDDLVSRLLRGCVDTGLAADVDWRLDCVPVDAAAAALLALARDAADGLQVLHLHHDAPRPWRELALWLRLNDYPVRLVPLADWLANIREQGAEGSPALHPLQPFLLARPAQLAGGSLVELYLESRRRQIDSSVSRQYLASRGVDLPALDAALLGRYLAHYRASGFLPGMPSAVVDDVPARLAQTVRTAVEAESDLGEFRASRLGGGILSELAAARGSGLVGLWHCRWQAGPVVRDAVLKLWPAQSHVDAASVAVAELCSPRLGAAFEKHLDGLANRGGAAREAAIAAQPALSAWLPRLLGRAATTDGDAQVWEYLGDVDLLGNDAGDHWARTHVDSAVKALADIHAVWYGRESELLAQPWLAVRCNGEAVPAMGELWSALADFSAPRFAAWLGDWGSRRQQRLVDSLPRWWADWLALPRTLIHNDFNPRNIAFRRTTAGPQLCAYDWELAAMGLPQYDLAELLCFVGDERYASADIEFWVEMHRQRLGLATGQAIDAADWRHGFRLALRYLMIARWPLYAMIDRFRPQPFLPGVIRNWRRLAEQFDPAARP